MSDNSDTILSPARAQRFGSRGAARVREQHTRLIEGEYVTTAAIAERLGVSPRVARDRITRALQAVGPVTWAGLGLT